MENWGTGKLGSRNIPQQKNKTVGKKGNKKLMSEITATGNGKRATGK